MTADATISKTWGIVMGLDTVELVMEVERTFGIAIPDADAGAITTVGELHRYVVAKVGLAASSSARSRCPSHVAFNRLRRALVEGLGVDRGAVRLASPMGAIVAIDGRRAAWDRLGQALGSPLPGLVRPPALVNGLTASVFIVVAAIVASEGLAGEPAWGCIASAVALSISLGILAGRLSTPLATEVPPGFTTVRDAVGMVLFGAVDSTRVEGTDPLDSASVWMILRALIVEQLGVHPDEVTEEASFGGDLGAG